MKERSGTGSSDDPFRGNQELGRRQFLKRIGKGFLIVSMHPVLSRCGSKDPAGNTRTFRFAVISDTHILPHAFSLQNFVFSLTADLFNDHDPPLDFVFCTGDVLDTLPSDDPAFYDENTNTVLHQFITLKSKLRMPLYLVMGNHDYYTGNALIHLPTPQKEAREALYMDRLGMPGPYYAIEHLGVKFYGLNSMQQDPDVNWEPHAVGTFGPDQLSWLRGELQDGKPAFFFHHHALATEVTTSSGISAWIPFEVPRAEGDFPKYSLTPYRDYTDPIYEILESRGSQVKATFFGHSHLFLRDQLSGVSLFMTDSMKFPSSSEYDGIPMRYHIVECEAGSGAFTVYNAYMIPYFNEIETRADRNRLADTMAALDCP